MMTAYGTLSPLEDWIRERWSDLSDEQTADIQRIWSAAETRIATSSLPGWMLRGMAPDSSDPERQQFVEYEEDVTNRARTVGLVQADSPPAHLLPAIAEVLAWLENHRLIAGPGNDVLPSRCAICHGPTVETAGWLCSPCYADPWRPVPEEDSAPSSEQALIDEDASEAPLVLPVLTAGDLSAVAPRRTPFRGKSQAKAAPVADAAALPAAELQEGNILFAAEPEQETGTTSPPEPSALTSNEEQLATPQTTETPEQAPFSLVLPDFVQPADSYASLCTDDVNRLRVEMILHMDRSPHRWQAIYASIDETSISREQFSLSKSMHTSLELELARRMTQASWVQTASGGWKAPWELE